MPVTDVSPVHTHTVATVKPTTDSAGVLTTLARDQLNLSLVVCFIYRYNTSSCYGLLGLLCAVYLLHYSVRLC